MKKVAILLVAFLLILITISAVFITFYLDSTVKKVVETVGPDIAKVKITLGDVSLSPLSGKGEITNLVVGNPQGFEAPDLLKAEKISVSIQPSSLLSKKVVVRSILIQKPVITFEGSLDGNNLSKLEENINQSLGVSSSEKRKLQVDELVIQGARLNVSISPLGGKGVTAPLPDIHLTNLGTGPDGITPGQLAQEITRSVLKDSTQAVTSMVGNLGEEATKGIEGAVKGLGGLFK